MKTFNWKVEGMSCANCALTIFKYLERKGLSHVSVNLAGGDVSFQMEGSLNDKEIEKGIEDLGYKVVVGDASGVSGQQKKTKHQGRYLRPLLISLPFTFLLMIPMVPGVHATALMNPWTQLLLCLPVYFLGMHSFFRSALSSVRNRMPNMNVLICLGASAAFLYSLIGTLWQLSHSYIFYETTAAIFTLIFFGNFLEDITIHSTQKELERLSRSQSVTAHMIAFDEHHQELEFPVDNSQLRAGDLVLIKTGELVPADCKILWGEVLVDESIVTGESLPHTRKAKDKLLGGSLLTSGTTKAQVTAAASESVLANIVNLVKRAQGAKPPIQQLADRISAVFVPIVLLIAVVTFFGNYLLIGHFTPSLLRAVAVLVIACPCAMGLATPAAIAVGLGRAARNGILFRNAKSLESFKRIGRVAFDKTGTLTTGKFVIQGWRVTDGIVSEEEFRKIAYSLEKYSTHPLARSIYDSWKAKDEIVWGTIQEIKGRGMEAVSRAGDRFQAGSFEMAKHLTDQEGHSIYLTRNDSLLGWIDLTDEPRPESAGVINYLHRQGLETVLLTGDRQAASSRLAKNLKIETVIAEQSPEQKLQKVKAMSLSMPTALVGDGINDAPALAEATVGISMSDASQLAVQTADVVLVNQGIRQLPLALALGKHTFLTIQQNLFWAFFYNVLAIPVAAFGLLSPTVAALAMALSDVVLLFNSLRLYVKQLIPAEVSGALS